MTCAACRALCLFVGLWSLVKFWLLPFLDFHRRRGTFFPSPDQWPVLRFSYPSRALLMLVPMMTSSTPDDFAPDQTKVALRNAPVHSPNPFSLTQIRWSFTVLRSLQPCVPEPPFFPHHASCFHRCRGQTPACGRPIWHSFTRQPCSVPFWRSPTRRTTSARCAMPTACQQLSCLCCPVLQLLLALIFYLISTVSITAGSHRLWAHKSYDATKPMRFLLMLGTCISNQGSIFGCACASGCIRR